MRSPIRLFRSSIRFRLASVFLVLVALILFVGIASYGIQRQLSQRVGALRSSQLIDLTSVDLARVGLEFEGFWNPAGSFVATDVEMGRPTDRPRLRGEVQHVDPAGRAFVLYGKRIVVPEDCAWEDVPGKPVPFGEIRSGSRVEVTCEVDERGWTAEKIQLRNVKASDKVKGTATAVDLDGRAPDSVEIHGLVVAVQPVTTEGAESALGHIEMATQMILGLQELQTAALDLVDGPHPEALSDPAGDPDAQPAARLTGSARRFGGLVLQALGPGLGPLSIASQDYVPHLRPLAAKAPSLEEEAAAIAELATHDTTAARARVRSILEPLVQEELLPLAYAYLSQAEEDLGDELRAVLEGTATTTRVALYASLVAILSAAVLGWLVYRSLHAPIRELRDAALQLGQGHMDTRIRVRSEDELGVLARAFNQMASELTSTTISMESFESVFDSMAAALIVFDSDGNIVNVNRATLDMVGRERAELIGNTFDVICRFSAGESVRPGPGVREPSGLPAMRIETAEKVFVRKDGSEFPVSLSGAELRSGGGPLQGYVCVAIDLTEQKRIQARLRESLEEKELLLREVHHRVKNNMQVISSLLAMQSSNGDAEVEKKLEESQSRIRSIALIHEQLYRSSELANIDARAYLETLTSQLLQSFGQSGNVGLELSVDPVELDIDQSMAMGLIVNELVTNSLKYAYADGRAGVIRVSLLERDDGERVLGVSDDGPGLASGNARKKTSLGLSLVSTLARQLRGRVETDGTNGMAVRVFFPRRFSESAAHRAKT